MAERVGAAGIPSVRGARRAAAGARSVQRVAQPQSPRALSVAVAPVVAARPAATRTRATCPLENRRDLHLRNGVLLI